MNRKITISILSLLLLATAGFAQSPYFFKTSETLEREKKEALQSGKSAVSTDISKELDARTTEYSKIELLQADLNKKLEAEDYFGAQAIKEEIEKLKEKLKKSDDLRGKIESSIAVEDFEKADQYKTELLSLTNKANTNTNTGNNVANNTYTTNETKQNQTISSGNGNAFMTIQSQNNNTNTKSMLISSNTSSNFDQSKYDDLMNKSKKYKRPGVAGVILGPIFMATGYALILSSVMPSVINDDDINMPLLITGAVLFPVGIIDLSIGASKLRKSKKLKREAEQLRVGACVTPINAPLFYGNQTWGVSTGIGLKYKF